MAAVWSEQERSELSDMVAAGMSLTRMSVRLGRSRNAIVRQSVRLGLTQQTPRNPPAAPPAIPEARRA